jgi:uncharacterized protein involved in type VI secretion and phage assembly
MMLMNGVVVGIVTKVRAGEVTVKYPWLHEKDEEEKESDWIRIATAMTGDDRGTFFMPEAEDEVLVAFEQGDFNHPYIVGFLWNGKDKPPENDTNIRMIKTKSGLKITFDDSSAEIEIDGGRKITINKQKIEFT